MDTPRYIASFVTINSSTWQAETHGKGYCATDTVAESKTTAVRQVLVLPIRQACVQVLQSFVSMVTLSLLILSGDVETNPGPNGKETPEYRTIVTCSATIRNNLAQGASDITSALFSSGAIAEPAHYDITSTNAGKGREQARILIEAIKAGTEVNSDVFHKFVAALKQSGPWTNDMVLYIMDKYEEIKKEHQISPSRKLRSQTVQVNERINEIARRHGLSPAQLDQQCSKSRLLPISKQIANWKAYAGYLGLSDQDETHIQCDQSLTLPHQRPEKMLEMWRTNNHKQSNINHYRYLLKACIEVENNALLAGNICDIIADQSYLPDCTVIRDADVGSGEPQAKRIKLDKCCDVPHQVFCELPPLLEVPGKGGLEESVERDAGGAAAQLAMEKLWAINGGKDVLNVFFMNPNKLGLLGLNETNIMSWAELWNHHSLGKDLIPRFRHTSDQAKSDIRIEIDINGRSWSKVGTDAESVNKSTTTMVLGLVCGNENYNRHIVIHEFGHALGLEHEHQRSKFWSVAKKYLDVEAMRKDDRLKKTNLKRDYLEKSQKGEGSEEYDPESIMHYWFDKKWLKKGYHEESTIREDKRKGILSDDEEKVLLGIHQRHLSYALKPSDTDYEFLAECYRRKYPDAHQTTKSATLGGPAGNPSKDQIESDEPDNEEAIARPESEEEVMSVEADRVQYHTRKPALTPPGPIRIGVIGSTNSGKSTTLNALLRGTFLPSSSGGTTAHVLCIKHDPSTPEGKLYDLAKDPDQQNPIATGENIFEELDALNQGARQQSTQKGGVNVPSKTKLELRIKMPFLDKDTDIELYDTPGTSEAKDSPIYEAALSIQQKMDGHILVLSQDTVLLDKPADLLKRLRESLPKMAEQDSYIPLVNKYDLFFSDYSGNQQPIAKKKQEIANGIQIPIGQLVFYSAKLGLEARLWQRDPQLAKEEDRYDNLKLCAKKIPELKEQVKAIQGINSERLSDIVERGSYICEAESVILNFVKVLESVKKQSIKKAM